MPPANLLNPNVRPDTSKVTRTVTADTDTTTTSLGLYAVDQIRLLPQLDLIGGLRGDLFVADLDSHIAGIPGFAGFFSKDMILWSAWNGPNYGKVFWAIGLVTAGFTSFYMFRLVILTFHGSPRYTHDDVAHVHESPPSMLIPLVILALFAIVAGYIGVPPILPAHLTNCELCSSSSRWGRSLTLAPLPDVWPFQTR